MSLDTVVFASPWIRLLERFHDQDPQPYHILDLPDYVNIVAVDDRQRLAVVWQYRPALERVTCEIVAGTIDDGESPLETAQRELAEEAGLRANNWTNLGSALSDGGRCNNKVHYFLAQQLSIIKPWQEEMGVKPGWLELDKATDEGGLDSSFNLYALMLAMPHLKKNS